MSSRVWNPPNRFDPVVIEWEEEPPVARVEVIEDHSRGVVAENDSPDVGFRYSVNPYRGCTHACAYCFARNSHEYLGFGAGSDFERKIVVKLDAPALLTEEFERPAWKGELVAFSGVTDCYQPLERKYALTRACLQVCARYRNPVSIITRSPLVARDLDVLLELHAYRAVRVNFSIPIPDAEIARCIEPGAPPPAARLKAMEVLAEAGIPVGVSVSPIIPGLNDAMIPDALRLARDAGASWAWMILVRLPGHVADVFEARLRERLPLRADAVLARIRRARDGKTNDPRFGHRMHGTGEAWKSTEQLFETWRRKLGYGPPPPMSERTPFRRPGPPGQLGLF